MKKGFYFFAFVIGAVMFVFSYFYGMFIATPHAESNIKLLWPIGISLLLLLVGTIGLFKKPPGE